MKKCEKDDVSSYINSLLVWDRIANKCCANFDAVSGKDLEDELTLYKKARANYSAAIEALAKVGIEVA